MEYSFFCYGHENIRATHHKTIEFTKETELSRRGTCIIGVNADFDLQSLKKLSGRVRVVVEIGDLADTFTATINPEFMDEHEIVFRKSRYSSARTLGWYLDKGANGISRKIIKLLQDRGSRMKVILISE